MERAIAAARAQKLLIVSILLNVLSLCLLSLWFPRPGIIFPALSPSAGNHVVPLIYGAITLFQSVCIYRMAKAIGAFSILYAVLIWIPPFGLLTIIYLNDRTNRFLKAAGLRVGLLGVRAEDIDAYIRG